MNPSSYFVQRVRDWVFLLTGAGVFALLLAALNWALFIRRPALPEAPRSSSAVSFSRAELDEALADFERRALQYESAPARLPPVADPGK